MSHAPPATISASAPEKNASSRPIRSLASAPRLRSCVTCRTRKVRCDKLSPCSNCRRANIACVVPPTDRPPRWARQLDRGPVDEGVRTPQMAEDHRVDQIMDRLGTLEGLVRKLSSEPGQPSSAKDGDRSGTEERSLSPTSNRGDGGSVSGHFGRLIQQDTGRGHYVSSGFWSRVSDELDALKIGTRDLTNNDTETSEEEVSTGDVPSADQGVDRTPSARHAFIFGHNLSPAPQAREAHPLPSQIPFLLDIFAENVNFPLQIVHMPTVTKMVRDLRSNDNSGLTPSNEALLLSIYYAAVTSMEEEDVLTNFGVTKTDLNLKYRIGLEYALAKADFLNCPNLTLVQAFTIFLFLLRRHETPSFVWMMTGLLIRMGQALGLQRDGARFPHLTPYEVEMRRRLWWAICMIDIRSSEDQGADLTITTGSFDTKIPLNINDTDISPSSLTQPPTDHEGLTDMSFPLICYEICSITRKIIALINQPTPPDLEKQNHLLCEMYQSVERNHFADTTDVSNLKSWIGITVARLTMAKMTLFIYLPVLFYAENGPHSTEIRDKLFASAIEVAEYNHALNSERRARHWRWAFQTYTHWHAIVYLLIEIARRPWSAIVERAWVALHSTWLIPAKAYTDKKTRTWVPLRKLMGKARRHRDAELGRLRGDLVAVGELEREDERIPELGSLGPLPIGVDVGELWRGRWRELVAGPVKLSTSGQSLEMGNTGSLLGVGERRKGVGNVDPGMFGSGQQESGGSFEGEIPDVPQDWAFDHPMGEDFVPWLGTDSDLSVDLDGEQVNWYGWVESAKNMEWETAANSSNRA